MSHLSRTALIALSIALMLALPCGAAYALEGGHELTAAGDSEIVTTQVDDVIASGTWGTCPWEITRDGKLTVHPGVAGGLDENRWVDYNNKIKSAVFESIGEDRVQAQAQSCENLFNDCYKLSSVDLSGLDTSRAKSMSHMFQGCLSLTSLDLSNLDTSEVEYMDGMFFGCESFTALDLSSLDTSKVKYTSDMFYDCKSLVTLDLSGFDTSSVTLMVEMFQGCSSLKSLDLSSFDTSNVEIMSNMFCDCKSLTSLDLSGFNTSEAKFMGSMFSGCSSLTSLDVSSFDTSGLDDMGGMFRGCSSLKSLDLSSFDTSGVEGMYFMFFGCKSLTSLDLSGFDTSKVQNMTEMFHDCSSLIDLDLSSFDTSRVWNMWGMFMGCSSLAALDLSSFDTYRCENMSAMFDGCWSLGRVSLGLDTVNLDTLPSSEVAGHRDWYSKAEQRWLSSEEIASSRLGIADVYLKISQADVNRASVTVPLQRFTGSALEPVPEVVLDGRALRAGVDFSVSYSNNVNIGTATATVTGKGLFEGTKAAPFKIVANVKRLWGQNALETMSAIVDEGGFKKGGTVMVATKDDYYDALTAAGYAGLADAPVLLTAKGALSPETSAQIKKLAPSRIVVCGGTAAVSANVESQLRAAAPKAAVERAWGQNAIGTANDVALKAVKATGKGFSGACFVATPNGYWDALAAAPVAYALGMPVFLANFDGTIDPSTLEAMRELGITRAYVAGGFAALPKTVESQLAAAKVKVEKRFAGRNACDTSQLVAAFGLSQGLSADRAGVATRDGYWDALCGAALCGHNRSVLVLAADDDRSAIDGFVRSHADDIAVAYVFGGAAAVSDATFRAVEAAAR